MPSARRATMTALYVSIVAIVAVAIVPTPARSEGFVAGGANADASTLGAAIREGAGTVGISRGVASATYRQTYANSSARPLDLQLVKLLFGEASRCVGSTDPVPLPDSVLPLEIEANSLRADATTLVEGEALFPGLYGAPSPGPAGRGTAVASSAPSARATTASPTIDLGILQMVNPSTVTEVSLQGNVRFATATSRADRLVFLGGLLVVDAPTWTATARSGATTTSDGAFTTTGGTLLGFPRTPAQAVGDLAGLSDLIRNVLGFAGVALDMPRVTADGATVSVSPLRLHLTDSPFGKAVLDPLMRIDVFGRPSLESQLTAALERASAESCDNRRMRQVVEIVIKVLRGSGVLELPIGGVSVSTNDIAPPPEVVFDDDPEPEPTLPVASPLPSGASTGVLGGSFGGSGIGGGNGGGYEPRSPVERIEPVAEIAADASSDRTTAPRDNVVDFAAPASERTERVPGATGGAGGPIGLALIGLAVAAALTQRTLDSRRRARIAP